jgi:hypothetical protein
MTPTTLSEHTPRTLRSHAPRTARQRSRKSRSHAHAGVGSSRTLAHYSDSDGCLREILARPGREGSVLVVDRDAGTRDDRRLVAHLAPDEPAENASVVCRHYLGDPGPRRCRPLVPEDLVTVPFRPDPPRLAAPSLEEIGGPASASPSAEAGLLDRQGYVHRLEPVDADMSILELRWCRRPAERAGHGSHAGEACAGADYAGIRRSDRVEADRSCRMEISWEAESVRDAVGCLEEYEPVRTLTAEALELHGEDPALSVAVLGAELRRLDASRIVLNRGLRRAVQRAMRVEGVSLSEIALRCGRIKRDSRGRASGETSWLARRIGLAAEGGGGGELTPWIHSEVLALIAREGLGVSPREVEL